MTSHTAATNLDDLADLRQLDQKGMFDLVTRFPQQCREAARIGSELPEEFRPNRPVLSIVVSGLGGSAIGGDMLRCLLEEYGDVPCVVNRDYGLPGFVGKETLVLAASYSGNTEETLAAYDQARERRAQIVCITSGGELAKRAERDGVLVCRIPGGQPPRASTGYLFFPALALLMRRGMFDRDLRPDIEETLDVLARLRVECDPETPTERNHAKQLALALHNRIPIIYGSQGYRGTVAVRWKCQFNENAKVHSFANVLPEMNHNEILAWTLASRQAPAWSVVFLREPEEKSSSSRIARRVEITRAIIGEAAEHHDVWAVGHSMLARMFSLLYLGDFVSVYAALLQRTDPTDISGIDRLKAELAASGPAST